MKSIGDEMKRSVIIRLWRDRRGAVAVWTVLMMVSLLGITALALDMGYVWMLKNQLQATADATALAGAGRLAPEGETPDVTLVKSTAVAFAGKNMAAAPHGTVLLEADVILGHWDGPTRTFTPHPDVTNPPGGETTNAVKTTTRRAEANGNAVPLFFARILRVYESDVVTSAIAEARGGGADNCVTNGIIAGGMVETGSTNSFVNSFCIHGELGVKVGSQSNFTGSELSMPDMAMLLHGSNNEGVDECLPWTDPPPPPPCVLSEQTLQPTLALTVATMINDMRNDLLINVLSNLPENVAITSVSTSLPANAGDTGQWGVPGTAYVIDGSVDVVGANRILDNIIIIATGSINIGSFYTLTNTVLASDTYVDLQSDGIIGQADFCSTGEGAVVIMAVENVKVGSNTDINGGQIITGAVADLQSDQITANGLAIQAVGDVRLGSQLSIVGCPTAQFPFEGPTAGLDFRLVN